MTTTEGKTISQINRSARMKGATFERNVAKALKPWWADVRRSRDNGSGVTADTGDIAGTHIRLFWSLKNNEQAASSPPGLLRSWILEATQKGKLQIPVLVLKHKGHANPLASWCYLWSSDFVDLHNRTFRESPNWSGLGFLVRSDLGDILKVLTAAGLTDRSVRNG